jgi:hypothetical protein
MKKSKTNWIKGAIKRPGALSKKLGVPVEKNIPMTKLKKAAKSSNKTTARQARLAMTLKKISAKRKGK